MTDAHATKTAAQFAGLAVAQMEFIMAQQNSGKTLTLAGNEMPSRKGDGYILITLGRNVSGPALHGVMRV